MVQNYYQVRESVGFKNVSLAVSAMLCYTGGLSLALGLQNILAAKAPNQETTFIHPDDLKLYDAWEDKVFEVQVANHELLGHGSGKLFTEDELGKFNFKREEVRIHVANTALTQRNKDDQPVHWQTHVC